MKKDSQKEHIDKDMFVPDDKKFQKRKNLLANPISIVNLDSPLTLVANIFHTSVKMKKTKE